MIASGEDKLSEAKRELRIADKALKEVSEPAHVALQPTESFEVARLCLTPLHPPFPAPSQSHAKLRMKKKDQVTCCTDDLKRKYSHKEWARILEEQRSLSDRRGWRRPWDGEDGEEFATWLALKATKARSHDDEEVSCSTRRGCWIRAHPPRPPPPAPSTNLVLRLVQPPPPRTGA